MLTIIFIFQIDASKAETESDDIANDYLEKKIEGTDEFLEKFVVSHSYFTNYSDFKIHSEFLFQTLRKTMYLRRVKLDKMRELIREQPSKTPVRKAPEPPGAANYTPPFGAPGANTTPYNLSGPSAAPSNNWDGSNPGGGLPYPLIPTMAMPAAPSYR